jgi:tRNA U34 5-methylaminomethyl-2-thiouridine-forming methyltransferase MnmC
MQRQIITTKDNSKTLLIPEMDETYHSINGALTEANHIFIENGINQFNGTSEVVSIFEMGFGTGLNAILTYRFACQHHINISYNAIEKYPVSDEEMEVLNYSKLLNLNNDEQLILHQMHHSFDRKNKLSEYFTFNLFKGDVKNMELNNQNYDVIYYDAFAPRHQPDLWQKEVLFKMYKSLKPNGFLITYCAQGQFKRNLKALGFEVVNLQGPPGKREITKAIKH